MRPTVLLIYSCLLLTDIHSRTVQYLLDEHREKCSINIFLASYQCCQVVSAWLISEDGSDLKRKLQTEGLSMKSWSISFLIKPKTVWQRS